MVKVVKMCDQRCHIDYEGKIQSLRDEVQQLQNARLSDSIRDRERKRRAQETPTWLRAIGDFEAVLRAELSFVPAEDVRAGKAAHIRLDLDACEAALRMLGDAERSLQVMIEEHKKTTLRYVSEALKASWPGNAISPALDANDPMALVD